MEKYCFKIKPRKCPVCKSNNILNILYGYPDDEASKAVSAGELVLGGCCAELDDPNWQCANCHVHLHKDWE